MPAVDVLTVIPIVAGRRVRSNLDGVVWLPPALSLIKKLKTFVVGQTLGVGIVVE